MTLKQEQEQELIISDLLLIAKAVKEHLKEPNCHRNIRSIVKQALESKSGLGNPTVPNHATVDDPTTTIPESKK